MERALKNILAEAHRDSIPVKDICFSGNGEPTYSEHFYAALGSAARIRDSDAAGADLVVITNASGLLDNAVFELLRRSAKGPMALNIWLKLDAGTPEWYARMNRSAVNFNTLLDRIRFFVTLVPVTIQTMLCAVDGKAPPPEEAAAWLDLAAGLAVAARESVMITERTAPRDPWPPFSASQTGAADGGAKPGIRGYQLYGKARAAPEDPLAQALPAEYLEKRAAALRAALEDAGCGGIPVEVFP